jgi:hypothetical protein
MSNPCSLKRLSFSILPFAANRPLELQIRADSPIPDLQVPTANNHAMLCSGSDLTSQSVTRIARDRSSSVSRHVNLVKGVKSSQVLSMSG